MNTNHFISQRIKRIEELLNHKKDESRKASMKGRRNFKDQLVGTIGMKSYNQMIIEVCSEIIKELQEENNELSESIDRMQS